MMLLLIALQAATATVPPAPAKPAPATASFSILVPVANEPCVPRRKDKKDGTARDDDIVVCGHPLPSQKLPYPEQVVPDRPQPSNPDLSGRGALAAGGTPCSTHMGGCTVGIDLFGAGTALVRLAQKAVAPGSCCEDPGEGTNPGLLIKDVAGGIGRAFRKKPDMSNRVAIPLDDAPPKSVILP